MMRVGAVLPGEDPGDDPRAVARLAQRAEALGFDAVWLPDHPLPPGPYGPIAGGGSYGGVFEALTLLAHIAALTSRITLGTSVLILPLREPVLLAKQVATLERLAPGRVVLGVGAGWQRDEFAALGVPFGERGARTDDALHLIERLHSTDDDRGVFAPRPTARVPIMVGGVSDAALRRAARAGDLWQAVGLSPDEFVTRRAVLESLAGPRRVSPGAVLPSDAMSLDPAELVGDARAWQAAGAEHLAVHFGAADEADERMTAFAAQWTAAGR
jgi:probable F420-dependent oxidoreductase